MMSPKAKTDGKSKIRRRVTSPGKRRVKEAVRNK